MKAAPFEYSRASDVDEACAMLAADDSARVIAGGQTLVPMMAMRLARPTRLIDINRIAALSYIREDGETIAIGATTRQCVVERDPLVARRLPLLARAMPFIGHAATRARGTIGGSLANADPAAELPLIAVTLDASLSYRAAGKTADMPAREFFIGPMITTLPAGACADRRAVSGLARQSRRRLSRGQCQAQRLRLCGGGGAGRAWRRWQMQAHCHWRRRGDRFSPAPGKCRAATERQRARRWRR